MVVKANIQVLGKLVMLQSIGIMVIKTKETMWSPMPVDIIVGI